MSHYQIRGLWTVPAYFVKSSALNTRKQELWRTECTSTALYVLLHFLPNLSLFTLPVCAFVSLCSDFLSQCWLVSCWCHQGVLPFRMVPSVWDNVWVLFMEQKASLWIPVPQCTFRTQQPPGGWTTQCGTNAGETEGKQINFVCFFSYTSCVSIKVMSSKKISFLHVYLKTAYRAVWCVLLWQLNKPRGCVIAR